MKDVQHLASEWNNPCVYVRVRRVSILVGGPETNDGVLTYHSFPRKTWNRAQQLLCRVWQPQDNKNVLLVACFELLEVKVISGRGGGEDVRCMCLCPLSLGRCVLQCD